MPAATASVTNSNRFGNLLQPKRSLQCVASGALCSTLHAPSVPHFSSNCHPPPLHNTVPSQVVANGAAAADQWKTDVVASLKAILGQTLSQFPPASLADVVGFALGTAGANPAVPPEVMALLSSCQTEVNAKLQTVLDALALGGSVTLTDMLNQMVPGAQVCGSPRGRICGTHAMRVSRVPFSLASGLLRHLKHGGFAAWLSMAAQIATKTAQLPAKTAQLPTEMDRDRRTRICVGMTIKGGEAYISTSEVATGDPHSDKH